MYKCQCTVYLKYKQISAFCLHKIFAYLCIYRLWKISSICSEKRFHECVIDRSLSERMDNLLSATLSPSASVDCSCRLLVFVFLFTLISLSHCIFLFIYCLRVLIFRVVYDILYMTVKEVFCSNV